MKKISTPFCLLLLSLVLSFTILSQHTFKPAKVSRSNDEVSAMIKKAYLEEIEQIPDHFTQKQKLYLIRKYADRKESSEEMLKSGFVIDNGELYNYMVELRDQIVQANPQISSDLKVFVVRDLSPNAFTVGDNIVYVNLGLLYRLRNNEELIYILCHEIAHNTLKHSKIAQEKYVDEIQNDSLTTELKRRMNKKYGNVSALNELMIPWLLSSKEFSRNNEFAADSLGMIYYTNMGLDPKMALGTFLMLEEADHERDTIWVNSQHWSGVSVCGHSCSKMNNTYKGSSINRAGLVKDDQYKDLLRSHPFEEERFTKLESDFNLTFDDQFHSDTFFLWKYYVENEMIHNSFMSENLGKTIFYILQNDSIHLDQGYADQMLSLSFAILGYEKSRRREGKWMGWLAEEDDKVYKDFYSYIRKLTPEQCIELAKCTFKEGVENEYTLHYQALIFAFNKEMEKFKIVYEKLKDMESELPSFRILEEFYDLNRLYVK
jgi:Zn-dependent protease with chaperone function